MCPLPGMLHSHSFIGAACWTLLTPRLFVIFLFFYSPHLSLLIILSWNTAWKWRDIHVLWMNWRCLCRSVFRKHVLCDCQCLKTPRKAEFFMSSLQGVRKINGSSLFIRSVVHFSSIVSVLSWRWLQKFRGNLVLLSEDGGDTFPSKRYQPLTRPLGVTTLRTAISKFNFGVIGWMYTVFCLEVQIEFY